MHSKKSTGRKITVHPFVHEVIEFNTRSQSAPFWSIKEFVVAPHTQNHWCLSPVFNLFFVVLNWFQEVTPFLSASVCRLFLLHAGAQTSLTLPTATLFRQCDKELLALCTVKTKRIVHSSAVNRLIPLHNVDPKTGTGTWLGPTSLPCGRPTIAHVHQTNLNSMKKKNSNPS